MEKSPVQADLQLMDNYVSEFSLNTYKKITSKEKLEMTANIGFRIVDIKENETVGQIELKYNVDITEDEDKIGQIAMTMNALFKGNENITREIFEEMLKINGATTLSHLCRAYINTATVLSGMPPITMPLINFCEFFKNAREEESVE